MKFRVLLLDCLMVTFAAGVLDAGDDPPNGAPILLQQSLSTPSQPGALEIAPQTGRERMLEIAPQPGNANPQGSADEAQREFKPWQNVAALDRNFQTDEQAEDRTPLEVSNGQRCGDAVGPHAGRKACLGIVVQYITHCYLGEEEHGLEIIKIDPDSPASAAGLHGKPEMKDRAPATATGRGIVPGLNAVVGWLLEKADADEGDLIIAVDGERIYDQADLDEKMARLRPGDTMYLTVLRPIGNGQHKTMKIAIRVGQWGRTYANAGAPSIPVPDTE